MSREEALERARRIWRSEANSNQIADEFLAIQSECEARHAEEIKGLLALLLQAQTDIGNLIASIRAIEEITDEDLEPEDAAVVAEIESRHRAGLPLDTQALAMQVAEEIRLKDKAIEVLRSKLEARVAKLEELEAKDREIEALKAERDEARGHANSFEESLTTAYEEITSLRERAELAENNSTVADAECVQYIDETKAKDRIIDAIRVESAERSRRITELESKNSALLHAVGDMKIVNDNLEAHVAALAEAIQVELDLHMDNCTCARCNHLFAALSADLLKLAAEHAAGQKALADLEAVRADFRVTVDRLCNRVWQLVYPGSESWEYPDQAINHLQQRIAEADKQAAEGEGLRAQLASLAEALQRAIKELMNGQAIRQHTTGLARAERTGVPPPPGYVDALEGLADNCDKAIVDLSHALTPDLQKLAAKARQAQEDSELLDFAERNSCIINPTGSDSGSDTVWVVETDNETENDEYEGKTLREALRSAIDKQTETP